MLLPRRRDHTDFGFVGHCIRGVLRPSHLIPFLLHNNVSVANYPPPPPLLQRNACSTVNGVPQTSHVRGGGQEGQAQAPPQSAPKFLSGEVSSIFKTGKNREPASSIERIVQFTFGSPANGLPQGLQLSFLHVHPHFPPFFMAILHLVRVQPGVQCLPCEGGGSEDLTALCRGTKVCRDFMRWVWDPYSCSFDTPSGTFSEGISDLLLGPP